MSSVKRVFLLPFFLLIAMASFAPASSQEASQHGPTGLAVDWSGFYVGLHGGYGWSNVDAGLGNVGVDGWIGGGHIGLQRQFDRWVLGIEASYSGGELDGQRTLDIGGAPLRLDAAISDLLLVTGRLGYAWDDRLLYIKAGYASADVEVGATFLGVTERASSRLDGWTAGFGLERFITPDIVIGLEYNYIDLGSKNFGAAPIPTNRAAGPAHIGDPEEPLPKPKIDPDGLHTVFARVTFKFGAAPAAHVPYK